MQSRVNGLASSDEGPTQVPPRPEAATEEERGLRAGGSCAQPGPGAWPSVLVLDAPGPPGGNIPGHTRASTAQWVLPGTFRRLFLKPILLRYNSHNIQHTH